MKIGIISFWDSQNNYGQVLQCFALQRFCSILGHDVCHIRYRFSPGSKLDKVLRLLGRVFSGHFLSYLQLRKENNSVTSPFLTLSARQREEDLKHPRHFDDFRAKYLKFTPELYDDAKLRKAPPEVDALICGSDQIWAGASIAYMLDFGPKSLRRIAYAPSMGGVKLQNAYLASEFRKKLRKLDIVTCREQDGVEECRRLGRFDAVLVPDPVFLLPKETYEEIAVLPAEKGYVLIYLLGNPTDVNAADIHQWAKRHDLGVKYVAAQGRIDKLHQEYPNIDEWLGLIRNAKYVFTNSFHGMALSIILNTPFLVIPISGELSRMNSRLTSTLENLRIADRIFSESLDEITSPVDFSAVNSRLACQRKELTENFNIWLKP